ncbi:MAG: uracil-DNA glycosylase [Methanobacteriota archaeon]|nr:MAG: uracil-DNA glycosylase [Euryarchaeota archaeon]
MPSARKDRTLRRMAKEIRQCRKCSLSQRRKNAVPGEGPSNARIFLVGEAPGKAEDEKGEPFVGMAGRVLDEALKKAGLHRSKVFITSVLRCRPPNNRNPKAKEIAACRPYLESYVETISPRVLVALGSYGLRGLVGKTLKVGETRGKRLDYKGTPVIATYHPAAVLYNRKLMRKLVSDLKKAKSKSQAKRSRGG